MPESDAKSGTGLRRSLGLPILALYGIGNLVGGGFYALMGKVTGLAGMYAPLAFLLAALIASFSALSFCELSARYPMSGGPASYVQQVFGRRWLAVVIGLLMVATGTISAATLARAVDGFLQEQFVHSEMLGLGILIAGLAGVAVWGISESAFLAVIITVIEVGGLCFVAFAAGTAEATTTAAVLPPLDLFAASGILMAAFLSFYAFVGFEDLVTLAEEVKDPRRTVPRAVIISVVVTTVLYIVVTTLALRVMSPDQLSSSRAPLSAVVERAGFELGGTLTYIGVLAGINGALMQLVMGSRVIYRLSANSERMRLLAWVSPKTQTPVAATILVAALTLGLALVLDLIALARATSLLLLVVFASVNLALFVIKRRKTVAPDRIRCYPAWVPAVGGLLCVGFAMVELFRVLGVM